MDVEVIEDDNATKDDSQNEQNSNITDQSPSEDVVVLDDDIVTGACFNLRFYFPIFPHLLNNSTVFISRMNKTIFKFFYLHAIPAIKTIKLPNGIICFRMRNNRFSP